MDSVVSNLCALASSRLSRSSDLTQGRKVERDAKLREMRPRFFGTPLRPCVKLKNNNAKTQRRDGAKNKNLWVYFTGIFDCAVFFCIREGATVSDHRKRQNQKILWRWLRNNQSFFPERHKKRRVVRDFI